MGKGKGDVIGRYRYELDTPCLLVDAARLRKNLRIMQEAVDGAGKKLRPHVKTHKCSTIARLQLEEGAVGVCTAKLAEAEALAGQGIDRILITGPVVFPLKEDRLMSLIERCGSLMVVLDDAEQAVLLSSCCRKRGVKVDVLLDVDPGLGRTGVPPSTAKDLGKRISDMPGLNLRGVQAYAGQVQHVSSHEERRRKSLTCMNRAQKAFRSLRDAGMAVDIFTGAGTGTFDIDTAVEDLTDLQVGSYVFMDAEYRAIGSAADRQSFTLFEPALTMLTSVVSCNQDCYVTVDAGLKSMYRDGSRPLVLYPEDRPYEFDWFGDEYGRISFEGERGSLRHGSVFELMVSHCDPTVNLFDRLHVIEGDRVVDVWPIDLRGMST
jgi:D-serine deaminase-like pyridoxal phosphate-dependent protein